MKNKMNRSKSIKINRMFNNLNFKVMKTKMFFRMMMASVLMLGVSNSYAQYGDIAEPDTIAVGSHARYKVDLYFNDINPAPLVYNASGVNWTFPAGYAAADFKQIDDVSALTTGADAAYDQKEIVMWSKAPLGIFTLSARELSRPILAVPGCLSGAATTRTIQIVAMPSINSFGADSGGCATPATLQVPASVTGYGKYDVQLTVTGYNMLGVGIGAPQTVNLSPLVNSRCVQANVATRFAISNATLLLASGAIPAAGCYWVVAATNMQDRISKKHLGYAFPGTTVANATPAGVDTYTFYNYVAPVTQPIQHIQNN
jgi:hypothetical protein